jgi:hypothetical protein
MGRLSARTQAAKVCYVTCRPARLFVDRRALNKLLASTAVTSARTNRTETLIGSVHATQSRGQRGCSRSGADALEHAVQLFREILAPSVAACLDEAQVVAHALQVEPGIHLEKLHGIDTILQSS